MFSLSLGSWEYIDNTAYDPEQTRISRIMCLARLKRRGDKGQRKGKTTSSCRNFKKIDFSLSGNHIKKHFKGGENWSFFFGCGRLDSLGHRFLDGISMQDVY